jgi:alanine racemase
MNHARNSSATGQSAESLRPSREESSSARDGRQTWAEINLDALAANYRAVCALVGAGVSVMGVVKADAYGHGAVQCARRLAAEGAQWFGVASPEEALALREAGLRHDILSFGGCWPGQESLCLRERITPVVYRLDAAEALDRAAREAGVVADVHVEIDTGMGRLGVRYDAATEFAARLSELKSLRADGLMTHFAAADEPGLDSFTNQQAERFRHAVAAFREAGLRPTYEHTANSAATFAHPATRCNMVRPGGVLYGLWRDVLPPHLRSVNLRPVMSVRSRVMLLKRIGAGETLGYGCTFEAERETLVATIPAGYHDGYMRALSNRGRAIVRGAYAKVVGRVSMDLALLDVTAIDGVAVGDLVTLIGDDGGLSVTAEELAAEAGTISYEVTCGVSARVPRLYLGSAL